MELKREQADLTAEREELVKLVESPQRQRTRLRKDLEKLRTVYGLDTLLGARRTTISEAAPARDIPLDAMIEKEPVTVILSKRGWIRAQRGHVAADQWAEFKFKEGDELLFAAHAQTTDKLLIAASDGRFFTIGADKLPGGRGFGEPLRLMVDIDPEAKIVAMIPASADGRLLLASSSGHGFIAQMAEVVAETRKGRNVVNLKTGAQLAVVRADRRRRRQRRGGRRKSQARRVPDRRSAGDGARSGGHAATLPRRRPVRRGQLCLCRRVKLGDGRRYGADADRDRPDPLARRARRGGANAANRFPTEQSLRLTVFSCRRKSLLYSRPTRPCANGERSHKTRCYAT